jgi:Tfp pilus assembly protein FimV
LILRLPLAAQDLLPTVVVVVVAAAALFPTSPRRFKNVCMASLKKSKRLVYPAKREKKREKKRECRRVMKTTTRSFPRTLHR